jgi:glycosyltransferase involved in cell wall biosynthesis
MRFVATSNNRESMPRAVRTIIGLLAASWLAATSRGAIFHLHVASRWSFVRKTLITLVAKAFGHRVILHVNGATFVDFLRRSGAIRRWARFCFRRADRVIEVSEIRRALLADVLPGCRWAVVPNPVALGTPPRPLNDRTRRAVFLGDLGARKGVPDLISAIRRLQANGDTSPFFLAGTGDVEGLRAEVSGLPRPDVVTVSYSLRPDEVIELLDDSTVFCLPSYAEGLPLALLEAMSRGLVCVTTPVGGIPDVIVDGVNGLLVEPGDVAGLARALEEALTPGPRAASLGGGARRTVERELSVDAVVERLVALYDNLDA